MPAIIRRYPALFSLLIITILAIVTGIGLFDYPWLNDDLFYRYRFREYFVEGKPVELSLLWDECVWRHMYDNSRLASFLTVFAIFLPNIVQTLLSVASLICVLWYGLKIADCRNSWTMTGLWSMLFICFTPWADQMYVFILQVAYLWGLVPTLALSYCILYNKGSNTAVYILAFITGVYQEALALPVLVGHATLVLLFPQFRTRRSLVCSALLFIGLVWLYMSPGGRLYRNGTGVFAERIHLILPYALPAFLLVATTLGAAIRWRRLPNPLLVYLSVASVVSAVVMIALPFGPRLGWWSCTGGWIGICYITGKITEKKPQLKNTANILAALCIAFTFVHLAVVNNLCSLERKVYKEAVDAYMATPCSTIYMEFPLREDMPLIALQKPLIANLATHGFERSAHKFYSPDACPPSYIPPTLKNYNDSLAPFIPGSRNELRLFDKYIIGEATEDNPSIEWLLTDYGDGRPACYRRFTRNDFYDSEGKRHTLYVPEFYGVFRKYDNRNLVTAAR